MTEHNIFYYPYASFAEKQIPLLKVAALYFDKLFLLDPEKASSQTIGVGKAANDVALLEEAEILVRVSPEEVLHKYEDAIAKAIRFDVNNYGFVKLCKSSGQEDRWRLALAKIPESIRDDPQFKPLDNSMQNLMGRLPHSLASNAGAYKEVYYESVNSFKYELGREKQKGGIEYRFADYPLPIGEAIMINHALFAGLLYGDATPITDDPFHHAVLNFKMKQASQIPAVRQVLEDRSRLRQIKASQLATTAFLDSQLKLPVLAPETPMKMILNHRRKHKDELGLVREKLGAIARRITTEPWSQDFYNELEYKTIPDMEKDLGEVRKARDAWIKSARLKLAVKLTGVTVGAATAALTLVTTPLTPIALATAGLGLASSVVIPGAEWLIEWGEGRKGLQENGLHYLLMYE